MSDKPISVGDLVMVVRGPICCRNPYKNGFTFKVESLFQGSNISICRFCGIIRTNYGGSVEGGGTTFFLERLKRIPPYEQLEHFRTEESLRRDVKEKA